MDWLEIEVRVPSELTELVMIVMGGFCHGGVVAEPALLHVPGSEDPILAVEQGTMVKGYLRENESVEATSSALRKAVYEVCTPAAYEERVVREEDWSSVWKRHSRIRRAGKRIVVSPTWKKPRPHAGDVVIYVDPGMAFGTGDHWTTLSCLQAMEAYLPPGAARVVDIGTGSGILSIAAVKLGAKAVLAVDVDALAVETAEANCRQNSVEGTVVVRGGSVEQIAAHGWQAGAVDLLLANLNSALHLQLGEEMFMVLRPGGIMVVSGIGRPSARMVRAHYRELGAQVAASRSNREWYTFVLSKPG